MSVSREEREQILLARDWSYQPVGERYGLLGIAGYEHPDSRWPGVTFTILDADDCGREVIRQETGGLADCERVYRRLVVQVDVMNSQEPS